jgi:hypothetical protein
MLGAGRHYYYLMLKHVLRGTGVHDSLSSGSVCSGGWSCHLLAEAGSLLDNDSLHITAGAFSFVVSEELILAQDYLLLGDW